MNNDQGVQGANAGNPAPTLYAPEISAHSAAYSPATPPVGTTGSLPAQPPWQYWSQIPLELRERKQWVLWAYETADGKITKVPYNVQGQKCNVKLEENWTTFEQACTIAHRLSIGIGFALTPDDPYVCIDCDVHVAPHPRPTPPEMLEYFGTLRSKFNSYTEFSPSGLGTHIWVRGKIINSDGKGIKHNDVEIYSQERYMTFTGNVIEGFNLPIADRNDDLNVLADYLRANQSKAAKQPMNDVAPVLSDDQVWAKAWRATNWPQIERVLQVTTLEQAQAIDPEWSCSEADASFVSRMVIHTPSDAQLIRLFLQTPLGQRLKGDKRRHNPNKPSAVFGAVTLARADRDAWLAKANNPEVDAMLAPLIAEAEAKRAENERAAKRKELEKRMRDWAAYDDAVQTYLRFNCDPATLTAPAFQRPLQTDIDELGAS